MKKRLLAAILVVALALSSMTTMVFALTFDDVENDPTVSWAKANINKMTEAGYIKGYEDGTFKPYRAISKLECLLLMARILGSEEEKYTAVADAALDLYSDTVSKYNTNYLGELTYLLYLGIITETDLASYASAANANTELLRHQAAVLMAKMAGRDTEAKEYALTSDYADYETIPAVSRSYVELMTAKGIMNGMDKTEDGEPQFFPLNSLTRAQMATLLSRMQDMLNQFSYTATVEELKLNESVIAMNQNDDVRDRELGDDAVAYQDGVAIDFDAIKAGSLVNVIEVDGHIQLVEVLEEGSGVSNKGTVVYAKISALLDAAQGQKITLADTEVSSATATYFVGEECVYTVRGAKARFGDLSKGDFVKAVIEDGFIDSIAVIDKTTTIEGTISAIDFDDDNHVYLTVEDQYDGAQQYVVSNKGAKVNRDEETAEYRELAVGDNVVLTLTYGKITNVVATSNAERFSGILREIILAKKSSLTIEIDGEERTFSLRLGAKIKVAGIDAEIYDLRPGNSVTGILEGEEIRTLNASSVVANEKGEFTAVAESVNTNYKVITVIDENDEEQSVYYNTKTKFLKNSGESATARDIKAGQTLNITGAETSGIFEATIIIIK